MHIYEVAKRLRPSVRAEYKTAVAAKDKDLVKILRQRVSDLNQILSQPKRKILSNAVYYATIPGRVLDFDGSDHAARQYGGTIVSFKNRIDIDDSAMGDRDPEYNVKREWIRSDVTDESWFIKAQIYWYRARIAAVNTKGSTAQWLLRQEFRIERKAESVKDRQYIVCGYMTPEDQSVIKFRR